MQRSAPEKPVIERNGACWGPTRMTFVLSTASCRVSSVEQPPRATPAASRTARAVRTVEVEDDMGSPLVGDVGVSGSRLP